MPTDYIRYDILTQEALRGVVRRVLADAAAKGLPGEHHFYVSFDTRAPGVKLSPRLMAQYPEEMTIVLQHQFWDLTVRDDAFEVGLSFNGVAERLLVPLTAIKGFFDPSVQFGLEFAAQPTAGEEGDETATMATPIPLREAVDEPPPVPSRKGPASVPVVPAAASASPPEEPPPERPGGGEVVRLDRFRKK